MTNQAQRSFLVTGVSSGIGLATARTLCERGHDVVGLSRRSPPGAVCRAWEHVDLANLETLPAQLESLTQRHPGLDGAVLCAGKGRFAALEEFSYQQLRELIDLDLTAQLYLARALLPRFKRRSAKQQARSDLVFVGSEAGVRGGRRGAVYCAAKFALRGAAEALREEASRSGVRVSLIQPGMVRTPFYDKLDYSPGDGVDHALVAQDVARLVVQMIELPAHAVISEVSITPLKHVVQRKSREGRGR